MAHPSKQANIDRATIEGFGKEWAAFDQTTLHGAAYERYFNEYFSLFPFDDLPAAAEGFDLGCGSGRWAVGMAGRVGHLHCIDPSSEALEVARRRLADFGNVDFHLAAADSIPLADDSQDFAYSLGVLHHVPDTRAALRDCVRKLKHGAPFLVYLYYSLDNRPAWFRALWRITDYGRKITARMPFLLRRSITDVIALSIYWPLARSSQLFERLGAQVEHIPLSAYRKASIYTMRTDALDRFGTRLEHRFSKSEIEGMMVAAGLRNIQFREGQPYWTACGRRAS